jgi:hypothetical protein
MFPVYPLAFISNASFLASQSTEAVILIILPLSFVRCSVALVPGAFTMLLTSLPLTFVLHDIFFLQITPKSLFTLPMF